VWAFSIALGVLCYWLLGFVVNDIATWPAPDYQEFEAERLDPKLVAEQKAIAEESDDIRREIRTRESRQALLRDSTNNSKQTMDQLLGVYRLSLEKNVEPTEAEKEALAEAEKRFLENQQADQTLNKELVELSERLRAVELREKQLEASLITARLPIQEEYQQFWQRHQYTLAAAKLGVLLPLLALVGWAFLRWRRTLYAPIVYVAGIALAVKVAAVMHDHFPARFFKYILIVVALAVVLRILIYLLRMIGQPSRDYLLRQYREAYERFFCPICDFPIRRGPLKYVFWSRGTIKKLKFPPQVSSQEDEPYCCPACGTQLFQKCEQCGQVRHSLLAACQHCGTTKAET
jgi:hypothetical protein